MATKPINVSIESKTSNQVDLKVQADTSTVDATLPTPTEVLGTFQAVYASLVATPPVVPTPAPPGV
jgi:hypothetical protein